MQSNKTKTIPQVQGIVIVNMLRKKLTEKVNAKIKALNTHREDVSTEQQYIEYICGVTAVANALDIISDAEYAAFVDNLLVIQNGLEIDPVNFDRIEEHYCKSYGFTETSLVFKINLQERLNENFARYTAPLVSAESFDKSDVLEANELIISFGKEFELLNASDYKKAVDMLEAYKKGDTSQKKLILVPENFYTKL